MLSRCISTAHDACGDLALAVSHRGEHVVEISLAEIVAKPEKGLAAHLLAHQQLELAQGDRRRGVVGHDTSSSSRSGSMSSGTWTRQLSATTPLWPLELATSP